MTIENIENYISPATLRRVAIKKAEERLIHLAHICDQDDDFQLFTVGVLGYILEALDPELARDAKS